MSNTAVMTFSLFTLPKLKPRHAALKKNRWYKPGYRIYHGDYKNSEYYALQRHRRELVRNGETVEIKRDV